MKVKLSVFNKLCVFKSTSSRSEFKIQRFLNTLVKYAI